MEARWSAMVGWERLWGGSEHLRKAVDKAAGERKQNAVLAAAMRAAAFILLPPHIHPTLIEVFAWCLRACLPWGRGGACNRHTDAS